jgi:hypothetical protein
MSFDLILKAIGVETTNNKGEVVPHSHKTGHFSYDIIFITIVVFIASVISVYVYIKRRMTKKYRQVVNKLIHVEMKNLKDNSTNTYSV